MVVFTVGILPLYFMLLEMKLEHSELGYLEVASDLVCCYGSEDH